MSTGTKSTAVPSRTSTDSRVPSGRIAIALLAVAVIASLVGLVISGSSYKPSPLGLDDPGPIVGWGLPVTDTIAFCCGLLTVGWLLLAAFLDPDAKKGTVSRRGRKALKRAAISAGIWCVAAFTAAIFTLADILGIKLGSALSPRIISTYAWDVQSVRTLMITSVLALIVCIGSIVSVTLTSATAWLVLAGVGVGVPALAGHAASLGNHSLAIVNGVAHAVASAVWVGGVIVLACIAWPRDSALRTAATRFSPIALGCVIILAISGFINSYTRLGAPSDLVTTGYGRLILLKTALLIVLVAFGYNMRSRILPTLDGPKSRSAFAKFASIEIVILAMSIGFGIALSQSAPTRKSVELTTAGESLLGSAYPPAPTVANIFFGVHLDILFLAIAVASTFYYFAGVIRLRRRGDTWPWYRSALWLVGILILIWATNLGIANYADVSVGYHMVQHMTLSMLAPIPLVLAAPVTLALRALKPSHTKGRGPRELLMSTLHSTPAKFITNPIVVLVLYSVGIYGLYLTPLFGNLMSSHLGHIAMTAHFLLSGLLLTWVAIGVDPQPRPLPYWARMLLVVAAIGFHALFAVVLMFTTTTLGANWYDIVRPPWMADTVADSMQGGQIAWAAGEIPTMLLLLIIAVQWARSDDREAKRRDRKVEREGDKELDDYNAYLAKLNDKSKK